VEAKCPRILGVSLTRACIPTVSAQRVVSQSIRCAGARFPDNRGKPHRPYSTNWACSASVRVSVDCLQIVTPLRPSFGGGRSSGRQDAKLHWSRFRSDRSRPRVPDASFRQAAGLVRSGGFLSRAVADQLDREYRKPRPRTSRLGEPFAHHLKRPRQPDETPCFSAAREHMLVVESVRETSRALRRKDTVLPANVPPRPPGDTLSSDFGRGRTTP